MIEHTTLEKLKVLFLGDNLSNAQSWINSFIKYTNSEVFTWELNRSSKIQCIKSLIFAKPQLMKLIKEVNPDVIIGYRTTSYGVLSAITGFRPNIIAAQGETDIWPPKGFIANIKKFFLKYALDNCDLIHLWGEHMKYFINEIGSYDEKFLILPRGIDLSIFKDNASHKIIDKIKMISTRSLSMDYGHEVILKALKILKQNNYEFEFKFIGDGPLKDKLIKLVDSYSLKENVIFTGKLSTEQIAHELSTAHIYISMPITEGVSASLFEAMACRCFPIVSKLPANENYITNGKNGFLINPQDSTLLANKIISVKNNDILFQSTVLNNINLVKKIADSKKNMNTFYNKYIELLNK